jgi:deazaflavin-dependent oxidoreductase (nitroreductase family)
MNRVQLTFLKAIVAFHIFIFRLTRGRWGAYFKNGPVLLLTTTGNKSGKPRTVPLMRFDDQDGKRYVIGSMGGNPTDPAWIKNLRKMPEVGVEVPGENYRAHATLLEGEARQQVYDRVKVAMTNFATYEKRAEGKREIPVVLLTPIA